jgi:hypothetical protein
MIKSRRMRRARHVAGIREMRYVYTILVENTEGKRTLGRLVRRRWEIIKMILKRNGMRWFGLDSSGQG